MRATHATSRPRLSLAVTAFASFAVACSNDAPPPDPFRPIGDAQTPPYDPTFCEMRAPLACPERFIPQVAVLNFTFAGNTTFLSVLNTNIYTAPRAGGTATLMVTLPFLPGQIVPSGALLYYVTIATPDNSGIYAMPQSGGAPRPLVSGID